MVLELDIGNATGEKIGLGFCGSLWFRFHFSYKFSLIAGKSMEHFQKHVFVLFVFLYVGKSKE